MNLTLRKNTVIVPDASSKFTPAAAYTVCACEVGAIAAAASPGTTVTVDSGHGFAANDYLLLNPGSSADAGYDAFVRVAGTTPTGLTLASSVTIAKGDVLFNLGPDGATGSTPDYDGSGVTIYSDMDGGDAITNSVVTADSSGNYEYWHKGGDIWEVIRNGTGVPVGWAAWSGQVATMTSATDNAILTADGASGRKIQATTASITDTGAMAVAGDLEVSGEMNSETLAVDTTSVLTGALTCSSTLQVDGATTQSGKLLCAGEIQVVGALNHDGTTVGFYGTTPAAQSAATTINELNPASTLNDNTAAALTDSSGGSASQTLAAITGGGGAGCEDATKNAIASLADEVNKLYADLENTNKFVAWLANKLKLTGIIG